MNKPAEPKSVKMIRRLTPVCVYNDENEPEVVMAQNYGDGKYVNYKDYASLTAANTKMKEALEKVESDLPILHADFDAKVETLDKIHEMRDYVHNCLYIPAPEETDK